MLTAGLLGIQCTPRPLQTVHSEPIAPSPAVTSDTVHPAPGALEQLLAAWDLNGDKRITKGKGQDVEPGRPPPVFDLPLAGGGTLRVSGTAHLANLVQELKLQEGAPHPAISVARITENPVDRLSRLIRERYWHGLTRIIDARSLRDVLADEKIDDRRTPPTEQIDGCTQLPLTGEKVSLLYVPRDDTVAFDYYANLAAKDPWFAVCRLPATVTPEWVQGLRATAQHGTRQGLLSLALRNGQPVPYVVPGGRFNELYGWDSYFHVLGLLNDGHPALARGVVDNLAYEVREYGKILNANRTYYLTRSQPPFFSSMVRALWSDTKPSPTKGWLEGVVETAISEYENVWTSGPRRSDVCSGDVCLSRYHGEGQGEPPEVEPGHFDWLYAPRARAAGMETSQYRAAYLARKLPPAELDALDEAFLHDRCMRESGHDTTYRWFEAGRDRCADFATVDLNSLLLKTELDLAWLLQAEFDGRLAGGQSTGAERAETTEKWCGRARQRLELLRNYLWDGERHLFFDFDVENRRRSSFVSATTLYPLWAVGENVCQLQLLDAGSRRALVDAALAQLEQPGGLSGSARSPSPPARARQWDYPNGWAPHQILAWRGLRQHGFGAEANRLTWRWLSMVVQNARDYHGTVPEKYDVVKRSHLVFAEYGNVGTDFAYITEEGFGWMNASVQVGLASLPPELREQLRRAAAREAQIPPTP